jgi:hypothetical protein
MLDQGLIARKIDFESLIAEKPGIAICGLEHINVSFNFFLDTVVRHLIISNNSISIIYILRGKFEEALIFILKAIRIRQVLLNSNLNFW